MASFAPTAAYPNKSRQIKIYREIESNNNGVMSYIKRYIHPKSQSLFAFVRQLSATERNSASAMANGSTILFVINGGRDVTQDCYVEWNGRTYEIDVPDDYDFSGIETKFFAHPVEPKSDYASIEELGWN